MKKTWAVIGIEKKVPYYNSKGEITDAYSSVSCNDSLFTGNFSKCETFADLYDEVKKDNGVEYTKLIVVRTWVKE